MEAPHKTNVFVLILVLQSSFWLTTGLLEKKFLLSIKTEPNSST